MTPPKMRYRWTVVMKTGDLQTGMADTFKEALDALSAWHGDGTLEDIKSFTILPKKDNYHEPTKRDY